MEKKKTLQEQQRRNPSPGMDRREIDVSWTKTNKITEFTDYNDRISDASYFSPLLQMFPNKFKPNWSLSGCGWAQRPADHLNHMCWRRQTSITCRAADQRRARTEKHTSPWKQKSCWVVKAVQNKFLHIKLRQKDSPKRTVRTWTSFGPYVSFCSLKIRNKQIKK